MSCCPSCVKRPLIAFISIIVLLLVLAFVFCSSCKNCEVQKEAVVTPPIIKEEIIKVEEEIKIPEVNPIDVVREEFINNNIIADNFTQKKEVLFERNRSNLNKKVMNEFHQNSQDAINTSKLAIVVGQACDLGNKEYNEALIQKRINLIVNSIKSKNPAIEILFSNDGQSKAPSVNLDKKDMEKYRQKERKVDVYFY